MFHGCHKRIKQHNSFQFLIVRTFNNINVLHSYGEKSVMSEVGYKTCVLLGCVLFPLLKVVTLPARYFCYGAAIIGVFIFHQC